MKDIPEDPKPSAELTAKAKAARKEQGLSDDMLSVMIGTKGNFNLFEISVGTRTDKGVVRNPKAAVRYMYLPDTTNASIDDTLAWLASRIGPDAAERQAVSFIVQAYNVKNRSTQRRGGAVGTRRTRFSRVA